MKRLMITVLALAMMTSLTACGKSVDNGSPKSSDKTSQSSTGTVKGSSKGSSGDIKADFLKTITAENAEAKGVCGTDLIWYYKDNVLVIKGTGDMSDPSTPPWQDYSDKIEWVIFDEGCTSISEKAFDPYYSEISKIELPNTLKRIDSYALMSVVQKEITIPASVEKWSDGNVPFDTVETMIFLGDAPEEMTPLSLKDQRGLQQDHVITIKYKGSGYDELIKDCPEFNWVKI